MQDGSRQPIIAASATMADPISIALVLFPHVTQLDLTGPVQVFSSLPGATLHLAWKTIEPVPTDSVLTLLPTTTFAECPQADVICIPGGFGVDAILNDAEIIDFIRRQAAGAKYITSVCTGSLALGAAGGSVTHAGANRAVPKAARRNGGARGSPSQRRRNLAAAGSGFPTAKRPPGTPDGLF